MRYKPRGETDHRRCLCVEAFCAGDSTGRGLSARDENEKAALTHRGVPVFEMSEWVFCDWYSRGANRERFRTRVSIRSDRLADRPDVATKVGLGYFQPTEPTDQPR